ncbi:MAG: hypothetical protein HY735_20845 [Verrucomicrobia bacterium]|nr:hypothetical protein [Verrucomicrobiota bacterium]
MNSSVAERVQFVRERIPPGGLFVGQAFRISPTPLLLEPAWASELESLGRVLVQFNRAVNLLYRQSAVGKQPAWIADWLDRGKPPELIELQRSPVFKNDLPRVIRPDVLITNSGLRITELDSVPGGIGLTAWLNQIYSELGGVDAETGIAASSKSSQRHPAKSSITGSPSAIIGGADGMLRGFEGIFDGAAKVHLVISEESSTYRPEMEWLAAQLGNSRFESRDSRFTAFAPGDAVYRFFELFDLANVGNAKRIFELARERRIRLTPPPKTVFEEKMLFALLWNRNLRGFWRQELGEGFLDRLLRLVPYTWLVDPTPLPPHGAIPELNLTHWQQLKTLSQRERDLILKVSGFCETAWGARGVYLGSDLSVSAWSEAVDLALRSFEKSPYVLQRYHKPKAIEFQWFDFGKHEPVAMQGRVRLCPYYFVVGEGDHARARLGGVLATVCPADKKIIHGMRDAVLVPCAA